MTSRELNIEKKIDFSSIFAFALSFCIIFLIENHEEKHEDHLIKSHDEETWRSFDRKLW